MEEIKEVKKEPLINLCERINPIEIKSSDFDKFSVNLNNDSELCYGIHSDISNGVNTNVLTTTSISDKLLKYSINSSAGFNRDISNRVVSYDMHMSENYLNRIFVNLVDQATHIFINNFIKKVNDHKNMCIDKDCLKNNEMYQYQRNFYPITKLLYYYIRSENDKQFAMAAVQLATLYSNDITLVLRNIVFNILSISNPNVSLESLHLVMKNLEINFSEFHDVVTDIIQHMSEIICEYYVNKKEYRLYDNSYSPYISEYDMF